MSKLVITVNGKSYDVEVEVLEEDSMEVMHSSSTVSPTQTAKRTISAPASRPKSASKSGGSASMEGNTLTSPINGVVLEVPVKVGAKVKEGEVVIILEAMKMKTNIYAVKNAVVKELLVSNGDNVESGQGLVVFE